MSELLLQLSILYYIMASYVTQDKVTRMENLVLNRSALLIINQNVMSTNHNLF